MTQYSILDHIARAYLYLGINTGEKDMFLELSRDKIMIVLKLSRDKIMTNSTPPGPSFLDPTLSLIISNFHFGITVNPRFGTKSFLEWGLPNLEFFFMPTHN